MIKPFLFFFVKAIIFNENALIFYEDFFVIEKTSPIFARTKGIRHNQERWESGLIHRFAKPAYE